MKIPKSSPVLLFAVLSIVAVLHFVAQGSQASGLNTLHGVVFDSSFDPLGNIEVVLLKRSSADAWEFITSVFSDETTGAFAFSGLADGDYTLEYSDPTGMWLHQFHEGRTAKDEADAIPLAGGMSSEIHATLQRASVIQGTVTSGMAPFAPLSSVPVTLWQWVGGAWSLVNTFTTNNDGVFRASGLVAGDYRLHMGYTGSADYFGIYYPEAETLEDAESVTLATGETRSGIDVRLPSKSSIAGSVVLPVGMQLAGIGVCAVADGTETDPLTGAPLVCAESDLSEVDGLYEIPNLHAGVYRLYLKDDAFPQRVFDRWYPAAPNGVVTETLQLATGATLAVEPIALIGANSVRGVVLSAQSTPASEMLVRLYEVTADGLRWDHTAYTDDTGRFELQLRRPGTWTVGYFDESGIHAPLYFPNVDTISSASVVSVPTQTVSINADTVLVTSRSLQGRVESGAGAGLAGIEVHAFLAADGGGRDERGRSSAEWLDSTLTDAAGNYALTGLGIESVRLYFRDPAGALQPQWYGEDGVGVATIGEAAPVTGATGGIQLATFVLDAPRGAEMTAGGDWRITNRVTGAGIADAQIVLYWLPGWRARINANDDEPYTCPSLASTGTNVVGVAAGVSPHAVVAFASTRTLLPDNNPIRSDGSGYFGWLLPAGCWQVRVEAAGYDSATSAVWGAGVGEVGTPDFSLTLNRTGGEPTATATASPTLSPTATPSATPSVTPSATPSRTPTSTPTTAPSSTSTSAPSATPTPIPTATSTPTLPSQVAPEGSPSPSPSATSQPSTTPSTPISTATPSLTPSSETPAAGTPTLPVTPDASPTVDPTEEPVTVTLSGVIYGDVNRNGRQEEGELGIGGVRLEIVDAISVVDVVAADEAPWQSIAATDNNGRFVFEGVPVGQYGLRVTPPTGMAILSPAILPLVVGSRDGVMPSLNVAVVLEPAPVLLPLVAN